jgi:hypothetical protein
LKVKPTTGFQKIFDAIEVRRALHVAHLAVFNGVPPCASDQVRRTKGCVSLEDNVVGKLDLAAFRDVQVHVRREAYQRLGHPGRRLSSSFFPTCPPLLTEDFSYIFRSSRPVVSPSRFLARHRARGSGGRLSGAGSSSPSAILRPKLMLSLQLGGAPITASSPFTALVSILGSSVVPRW